MENVTLDMIYAELKSIRKELMVVEHAVIPVEKITENELAEHKRALDEALKNRVDFRTLKR